MARPRNICFFEEILPTVLPDGQEWLQSYHENSRKLVEYMVKNGASSTVYHTTIRCLTELRNYLLRKGIAYSIDAAICWFANTGPYPKCYQATLFRMADLYGFNEIQPVNAFPRVLSYIKELREPWRSLLLSFLDTLNIKEKSKKQIRNCISRFLYRIQKCGITSPSDITFDFLEDYCRTDGHRSENSGVRYTYAIGDILLFMAENGLCVHSLGWYPYFRMHARILYLRDLTEEEITRVHILKSESLAFPAEEFAVLIPDFLKRFHSQGYSKSPCKAASHTLYNLLLFLEMHGLGYHRDIADIWLSHEKSFYRGDGWKQVRRILHLFDIYTQSGEVAPQVIYKGKHRLFEALPSWCRTELDGYMILKEKEGWERSTLDMIRSSVTRFCSFLAEQGLAGFSELTPAILKKFNRHDNHCSVEGKNAYNGRIRRFIRFLEREKIVPYGMNQALYCTAAEKEKIVVTLNEDEKRKIQQKPSGCVSPIELRDRAMLLLGLRMGLRASDIVTIKLYDIDWEKQSIRILQEKTDHEILLPMPTDVGNAIYLYLTRGRPNPKTDSGYLFVKGRAPYDPLHRGVCNKALKKALPDRNIPGSGFHVTRKTFATDCLRNGSGKQAIADLLGHKGTASLNPYLQLDEKRMRMCPISLAEAGLQMEGGRYGTI